MSDLSGGDTEASQERQAQWDEWSRRTAEIEAKYKPVDLKVRELVTGLNALGIKTSQSCEGHNEQGKDHLPFIGIGDQWRTDSETVDALQRYLDKFYSSRQEVPEDVRVILLDYDPDYPFTNVALVNQLRPPVQSDMANENLPACQEEMIAFGHFLKREFLSSPPEPKT